jgi:hypothetical protein
VILCAFPCFRLRQQLPEPLLPVNIRQIQKWLGHHSLDVTINYLADEDDTSEPVRDQVNSAFSAFV